MKSIVYTVALSAVLVAFAVVMAAPSNDEAKADEATKVVDVAIFDEDDEPLVQDR